MTGGLYTEADPAAQGTPQTSSLQPRASPPAETLWDRRLPPRTPMAGVYLCGAATHPGGGVSAVNGRNAAMAALADLRKVNS